ncbi:alkaline phosphatase family protein [Rhodanobacter thiooxydans]|uniref:alkaline phosphatase family protein n=1 Tax=Rhodanobacter thiooxydans TaxID=416169 RepID=UPI0009EF2E69|nr:RICIN domain-containing protein [Rhodanobacter thiooxydans]MCW0202647.1 RICIN domain-containing protein [Rhodanobacter thiooxydans]
MLAVVAVATVGNAHAFDAKPSGYQALNGAVNTPTRSTTTTPDHKGQFSSLSATAATSGMIPRYDHVVIVVMENASRSSIVGNTVDAPYINSLLSSGANFTQAYAVTHPSQPNYVALFSGSAQGITDDSCPHTFGTDNLGNQLIAAGHTFAGYSETMPSIGYSGCGYGLSGYVRRHNPWVNFSNLSPSTNLPYTAFPSDFTQLPTLSFVIPNLCNDMHDCSITTGDNWLSTHIGAYVNWAKTHNSLLILTWDENDSLAEANQIITLFVGANINAGAYAERIDHYRVLRTLEDMYGLAPLGNASAATPITDVWSTTTSAPDFGVLTSPTSVGVSQGAQAASTVTVSGSSGFNSAVTLSASGLPSGVTATFSPASLMPSSSGSVTSTLTLSAGPSAAVGSATVTVTAVAGSLVHNSTINLTVNAPVGVAYWVKNVNSGLVVDDPRSSTTSNTQLIQYPKSGYNNQKWVFTQGVSGSWTIKNVLSGLCAAVANASTSLRAAVVQATCTGGAEQQWQRKIQGSGYELINQHSGQCLDVPNSSTTKGTGLIQYPCHGGPNQQWTLMQAN